MKIVEAPRDAFQGFGVFIPTEQKIQYLNALLRIGFDTLDVGSFVSSKAMPHLHDTAEVLQGLDLSVSNTRLQVVVANERGAQAACLHQSVSYLAVPHSVSATFARLNTNCSLEQSIERLLQIDSLARSHQKQVIVYLNMAFGNPYEDPWSIEDLAETLYMLRERGFRHIVLDDTTGMAPAETLETVLKNTISAFPELEIGLHLHTEPHLFIEKVDAAYRAGCRRFDTVLNGLGGNPRTERGQIGNLRTGSLISYIERAGVQLNINRMAFLDAVKYAKLVFPPVPVQY